MAKKSNTAARRQEREEKRKLQIGLGVLLVAAVLFVIIVLFGQGQSAAGLPATVSTQRGYELYQQGAFVLDVREQQEWDEFHAPNTTLIPLGELEQRVSELPKDKQIVVVCRSGNRSDEGRDILKRAGFTNVTSMDGGLNAWRDLGYPIEP